MLPEFLVNLGEELNQPIPASLADQVRLGNPTRTPSPALSSKPLSVQSVASQQDGIDSHRSGARDLRYAFCDDLVIFSRFQSTDRFLTIADQERYPDNLVSMSFSIKSRSLCLIRSRSQ